MSPARPDSFLLVSCSLLVALSSACSDGSSPSCPRVFNSSSVPSSWEEGKFYDPSVSVSVCSRNLTACASTFRGLYAGGVTCEALKAPPSGRLIAIAIVAFLIGSCSLCTPCATPTCICGRASPAVACSGAFVLHLALFSTAAATLTATIAAVGRRRGDWGVAEMASALRDAVAGGAPAAHVLLKAGAIRPFEGIDVVAGIATGPVGLIVLAVTAALAALLAFASVCSGGSSSGGSGRCKGDLECLSCSGGGGAALPSCSCVGALCQVSWGWG